MGTVSTALKLFDQMTRPLQQVTQSLNSTVSTMENLSNVANKDIRITNNLNAAKTSIQHTSASLQDLANQQEKAKNGQDRLNNSFNNTQHVTSGLSRKIGGLISAYLGFQATKAGMNEVDNFTNQTARLALINDGLQTQTEFQNKIYQSAQRARAEYGETVSVVAKLGLLAKDAFSGNNETIKFAELMSKSFKISGASASEATNGMYQLTQAMASGRLQGDEFRSVMENAPMLAQAIAKYTGKSMGELREMSAKGEITASIIKQSLFKAADDINAKFKTMPMTFETVWTRIKNTALMEFSTIMSNVNGLLNSSNGTALINGITSSIRGLRIAIGSVLNIAMSTAAFFINNWSWISPIVWGIVAAFIAYNAISLVTNGILIGQAALKSISAAATVAQAGATFLATVAQEGLNAALLACPITWIILGIIALIVLFYAAVGAVNHFAGTSVSATGIIAGVFMGALAFIGNLFVAAFNLIIDGLAFVWNFTTAFVEFFANVFIDPIGSVVRLFSSMADSVLEILKGIASAVDTLFGSNLAASVSGWRSSLQGMTDNLVGEAKIKVDRIDTSKMHLNRFGYDQSFNSGYSAGKNTEEKFDLSKVLGGGAKDFGNISDLDKMGNLNNGLNDINKGVKGINDKIDISNEQLEMMRDLAEQESIQNFVSLTPTVQITTGDIREEADVNKIIAHIENYMSNELVASAEGVYL